MKVLTMIWVGSNARQTETTLRHPWPSHFLQQIVFISFSYSAFSAYHPHTNHHHQLFKSAKLHNSELRQMLDCKCVWLNFCFYHKLESSMLTILTMSTWTRNAFETFHKFFICKFSALLFILLFFCNFLLLFGLWLLLFWYLYIVDNI